MLARANEPTRVLPLCRMLTLSLFSNLFPLDLTPLRGDSEWGGVVAFLVE